MSLRTPMPRLDEPPVLLRAFEPAESVLVVMAASDPLIPLISSVPPAPDPDLARRSSTANMRGSPTATATPSRLPTREAARPSARSSGSPGCATAGPALATGSSLHIAGAARGPCAYGALVGALLGPTSTASSCSSSRGTSHRGERQSARATSGRGCCAAGSRWETSAATCLCTRCCPQAAADRLHHQIIPRRVRRRGVRG